MKTKRKALILNDSCLQLTMQIVSRIASYVYILFYIVTILPVWLTDYFHTGDGPSHLYVSAVLADFAKGDSIFTEYFTLNTVPVPNTLVHVFYAALLLVFSPSVATKILISVVIWLFTFGFYEFIRCITESKVVPVSIFFLVYAFPLKMGLYAFLAGTGAMFLTLAFYTGRYCMNNRKHLFLLTILLVFTWMCHLFPFLLLMFWLPLFEVLNAFSDQEIRANGDLRRKLFSLLLVFLPGFILTLIFSSEALHANTIRYAGLESRKAWALSMTAMEFFGTDHEFIARKIFFVLLAGSVLSLLIYRNPCRPAIKFISVVLLILTLLYFTMPDDVFSGGMVSLRILFIILAVACIFIDVAIRLPWMQWIKIPLVFIAICFSASGTYSNMKPYSDEVKRIIEAGKTIKPGSTVLPVNYSENYLHYNYLLYLSSNTHTIVFDNAQAATPNCIIRWKEKKWNQYHASFLSADPKDLDSILLSEWHEFDFDYLVRWLPPDESIIDFEKDSVYHPETGLQIVKIKKATR